MKKLFLIVLFLGGCDTIVMQYPEEESDSYETSPDASDSWDGNTSGTDSVDTDSLLPDSNSTDSSTGVETQTSTDTATAETDSQTVDSDSEPCTQGELTCWEISSGLTALVKCDEWGVFELVEYCTFCDPVKLRCYDCIDGEEDCYRVCMDGRWKIRQIEGLPAVCPDGFTCDYKPNGDMYCDPN
jgi:hypothetical protein